MSLNYYAFDFPNVDIDSILHHLSNSELMSCFLYTDVEDVWNIIKSPILSNMHKFIPKYRLKSHSSLKWFTSEIRHLLNCLKSLRKFKDINYILHRIILIILNLLKAIFNIRYQLLKLIMHASSC